MGFSFKYIRYSAIVQIILGVLNIVFGIADRAVDYRMYTFHSISLMPIWMGVWFVITGVIGVYGSKRSNATNGRPSRQLICSYLVFSVVSTVFAAFLIIFYGVGVGNMSCGSRWEHSSKYNYTSKRYVYTSKLVFPPKECNARVALGSFVIVFAVFEFFSGILASVCACTVNGCCTSLPSQSRQPEQLGQVIYVQTQNGPQAYIMTQGANGVPVAVPAMVPGQVQMSTVPASQAMYPSPAGAPGGGAEGGGTHNAQTPSLQTKSRDIPPAYVP